MCHAYYLSAGGTLIWSTIKEQRGACHATPRCLFVFLFRACCDLLWGLFMLSNSNPGLVVAYITHQLKYISGSGTLWLVIVLILQKVGCHSYRLGGGVTTQGSEVVHEVPHGINGRFTSGVWLHYGENCVSICEAKFFTLKFPRRSPVDVVDMEGVFLFRCVVNTSPLLLHCVVLVFGSVLPSLETRHFPYV